MFSWSPIYFLNQQHSTNINVVMWWDYDTASINHAAVAQRCSIVAHFFYIISDQSCGRSLGTRVTTIWVIWLNFWSALSACPFFPFLTGICNYYVMIVVHFIFHLLLFIDHCWMLTVSTMGWVPHLYEICQCLESLANSQFNNLA